MGFRITVQTLAVLRVLLDHPLQRHYGLEVAKAAGLASGSLYPILARPEQQGWLTSDWEQVDQRQAGRPRRRYYQLTPEGAAGAAQALAATVELLSPQPGSGARPAPRPGWGVSL
jgi:PadR family transcriptional regulator, regulatory protein PadR